MARKLKIKKNQVWKDKKTGDIMWISSKHGGNWNCRFTRGRVTHKMTEFAINKYYEPVE